jgi:hypothetical protein
MNSLLPALETPKAAARRLSAGAIRDGYKPEGLHVYDDADGSPLYWKIRLRHSDGRKWLRPMRNAGNGFELAEPPTPPEGKPLYRLSELAAADPATTIWIVEGEKCANVLAKLGMIVTTSGAADSATAANWAPLRSRNCIVWPDNDAAGARYAEAVAGRLHALGCTVELIDAAALGLPDKGDCVDWRAQHPDATAADVLALPVSKVVESRGADVGSIGTVGQSANSDTSRSEPEPLRRPVPPPEPYPVAELGPILQPACEAMQRVIQAPDAVCGASLLAAASLAVQGLADVHIDGRVIPLTLWLLTVAESGERKSACDSEAMRPAREHEKVLAKAYADALAAHEDELEEWNAKRDAAKTAAKKSKGEGTAKGLRDVGPAPLPPLQPKLTIADFTAEGLSKLLAVGLPSIGAFTDEAVLVFGGHGMTKETTARTAGTLCKLWDSGTLDRIRAGDGATKVYGRRLAMHLMAQPVIAELALSDDVLSGQGFLARCLLAWPQSTAGTRTYVAESLRDDAAMIRYTAILAARHALPLPIAEGERNELAPRALRLSADAFTVWRGVHDTVEVAIVPGERYATVKAWAGKTPEQCLRIAGVLTLIDHADATTIEAPAVQRAAEIALWHLNEAVRLAGTAELSAEVRDAEALLDWAHATGRGKLHSRDALRLGPARIRERERFNIAMGELERAGWAEYIEGGAVLDGAHRRHVWRITQRET